ncbi:VOC family protein [Jatrophihabitans sp. YIM 134969]
MADRAAAGLGQTVPALPVREIPAAVDFYEQRYGFECVHRDDGFAVLVRDAARIHLWRADDASWQERSDLSERPVRSGAESFLAGTASCRVETADVDALFAEYRRTAVLHGLSGDGITTTDFGTYEFSTLDLDGNLVEFYRWIS